MEKICRFCLKVSIKNTCSLQECDILYNIQRFLKLDISAEDFFPNNLCKECFKKVSQLIKFCITLQDNEAELQKYAKNGLLENYYAIILENAKKENEQTECKKPERVALIKIEEETGSDYEDYDHLKNEEFSDDLNETQYSSEDETASSKQLRVTAVPSIMKKKLKTLVNNVEDSNIISKFKPVKGLENFKRKRKADPVVFEYVKQFTCLTCLEQCENQSDLAKHYYAEHYSQQTVLKKYSEHKSEDKTLYTCNICKETCDLKKDIVKHVMIHSDDRPLTCKICARTYRTVPDIVRHARAHNGIKLQCPYNCGFSTAYQGAMKEHTSKHLDEYKYTCDICGKGFNTKTWFDQHHNIHTGAKPYKCDICGIAFPMTRYLQTHKASNHPQSSNLKRYRCVHCGEQCDSANSLAIHMQSHGIKQEKDFLCDFCGKILATAYQLQYHHRMHLGVKPYSCSICKKKFAKKYNVQLHMTIHSGDKPHACGRCGKQYSQRATLLRHLKRYHPGTSSENTGET